MILMATAAIAVGIGIPIVTEMAIIIVIVIVILRIVAIQIVVVVAMATVTVTVTATVTVTSVTVELSRKKAILRDTLGMPGGALLIWKYIRLCYWRQRVVHVFIANTVCHVDQHPRMHSCTHTCIGVF